jgi:sterol desaturase/sphingolipid hydroxylase (fatty acid hydroxylase superfamily)
MKKDPTILGVLIGLAILSALFFLIERVVGRGRRQPVIRKGWWTDVLYWIFTPFVTKQITKAVIVLPVLALVLAHVTSVDALKLGTYRGFGPISHLPIWVQVIMIYVLGDFIGYWTHRLFHSRRWWPFHAVHHSSEELDWLGSVRVHPINDLVNKLAEVTPLLLLGFNVFATLSAAVFFTFYAIFVHANVNWDFGPLRSVIATPVFHRWHHSKDQEAWDKNFAGLLPLWDILFGTYYMPQGRWPENFGIHDPMPKTFWGQLWEPFAWWARIRKNHPVTPLVAEASPSVKPAPVLVGADQ